MGSRITRVGGRAPLLLVLLLTLGPAGTAVADVEDGCVWKTSDIVDPRIDIGAQQALFGMLSSGAPEEKAAASAMIGAIKTETLAGILLPPRRAVSERGERMKPPRGYWELLQGAESRCLLEPEGELPLILYREAMEGDGVIDALMAAWPDCELPTPNPPCGYVVDLWRPPQECSVDQDCIDKGLGWKCLDGNCVECESAEDCSRNQAGNVCTEDNKCKYEFDDAPIDGDPDPDPKPVPCDYDYHCPNGVCHENRCLEVAELQCTETVHTHWREQDEQCEEDEKPRLAECATKYWGKGGPLGLAKCLHDSYSEKEECKRTAWRKYEEEKKKCLQRT